MSTILIDSLNCNPSPGSNAESGYGFVREALKHHRVILLTHGELFDRRPNPLAENPPSNLEIIRIQPGPLRKLGRQADYLSQCYFHARKILCSRPVDIVHTVEPNQYRLTRPLSLLKKLPFVLGPLNGGDAYPPQSFLRDIAGRYRAIFAGGRPPVRRGAAWIADRINTSLVHGALARASTAQAFARADRIVIGTHNCLNNIPRHHHGKCTQVPCFGIDTSFFSPRLGRGAKRPPPVIGYVGRISESKGLDFLLAAVGAMRSDTPVILKIAGTGAGNPADEAFERYCRQRVAELGIESSVSFLGQVPRSSLPDFYRNCDLFCLPSLWEPLGMVYLEAMACGCPVVAMNSGGPRELIAPPAGVLVDPRTHTQFVADLALALRDLIADANKRRAMGAAARDYVIENYTWGVVGEKMARVYAELTG
jgi:glycosyltransferase involved in cell wall biosynthesis